MKKMILLMAVVALAAARWNVTTPDNLSYCGYGTIRVPRGLSGW